MSALTPNEERWCDWLESLDPASQLKQDGAGWISRDAFVGGIESEAVRLRPLLERCIAEIGRHVDPYCNHQSLESGAQADGLVADIRCELKMEGQPGLCPDGKPHERSKREGCERYCWRCGFDLKEVR